MKIFRKSRIALLVVLLMVLSLVVPEAGELKAESNNQFSLSMSVKNGMASMVINGTTITEYQLTETNTVEDAGFSADGTLWLLFKNNWILWYNYQYEGEGDIGLHALDDQVQELTKDNNGDINGYLKNGQNKDLLTTDQIKDIIEYGDCKFAIPVKIGTTTPTTKPTSKVTATPIPTVKPTSTVVTSPTAKPTVTSAPIRNQYRISFKESKGKTLLTLNGVEYEVTEESVTEDLGFDKNGTFFLLTRPTEGGLLLWYSPAYQDLNNIQLYILDSNVTSLEKDNYNRIVGYVTGAGEEKELPTEEKVIEIINQGSLPQIGELPIKATTSTVVPSKTSKPTTTSTVAPSKTAKPTTTATAAPTKTSKPTTTVVPKQTAKPTVKPTAKPKDEIYAYSVTTKGTTKVLKNSNNKQVDTFKLAKGVLKYHNLKMRRVKAAEFNAKGNVVIITKSGSLQVINRLTLKKTIKKKSIKSFIYTAKGIAKYAVKKGNVKIKLSSY